MLNQIIEKLVQWGETYPYKTAVLEGGASVNYRKLVSDTAKITEWLQHKRIGKEEIVAVSMERSYEYICTILGVIASGAAFLPVDIKLPADRIKFMLKVSGAKCVITKGDAGNQSIFDRQFNVEDILDDTLEASRLKAPQVTEQDLAYVIFTSGSTGKPKGVMIEYGGLQNHLEAKRHILNLDETSIVAHNASISFDISVWQVLSPICAGGTVRVFSNMEVMHVKRFIKAVKEDEITVLEVVPAYLNMIIKAVKQSETSLPDLMYVLCTGETLTNDLAGRWFEQFPIPLINAYGPTEASDDVTHFILHPEDNYENIPIGKPVANAELYIADPSGAQCGMGECGELWIGGICVGRGYVRDTGETDKFFVTDEKTGKRFYKTGDLAALYEDGNYRFFGRVDTQIKIHGYRIEVKEIENVMEQHDCIREAMVIFLKEKDCFAACYVAETTISAQELKAYMEQKLPEYMIPSIMLRIEEVPYNLNGKVDYEKGRRMLEAILQKQREGYLEQAVIQKIESLIPQYGQGMLKEESWKDVRMIGLSSLSVMDLIVELEEAFDIEMDEVFLEGTKMFDLKGMADFIIKEIANRDGLLIG